MLYIWEIFDELVTFHRYSIFINGPNRDSCYQKTFIIHVGENLRQRSRLEIRLKSLCWSTIPQKQFIIIIIIIDLWCKVWVYINNKLFIYNFMFTGLIVCLVLFEHLWSYVWEYILKHIHFSQFSTMEWARCYIFKMEWARCCIFKMEWARCYIFKK